MIQCSRTPLRLYLQIYVELALAIGFAIFGALAVVGSFQPLYVSGSTSLVYVGSMFVA